MTSGATVIAAIRKNNRSRPRLLFLSTLAIVSLPAVYSWMTMTPSFVMKSPLALRVSPAICIDRRFMALKSCRKSPLGQGVFHLRSQEAAKSASDISVLNERLWSAAELGDEQTIRTLISVGAEVNSQPIVTTPESEDRKPLLDEPVRGPSALHLAAGNGKSKAVCALVELGGDVTTRDADLNTPLHAAVIGGHLGEPRPLFTPRPHWHPPPASDPAPSPSPHPLLFPEPTSRCLPAKLPPPATHDAPPRPAPTPRLADTVQVLVTLGADLKSRDKRGLTPLGAGRESPACGEELMALLKALSVGVADDEPKPASPPPP